MKLKVAVAGSMLLALTSLAQAQEYLDTIAKSVCECAAKIPDSTPAADLKTQAGICIIQQLPPYKDRLKADFGLNLDQLDKEGERMGQIVGLRLATACPATLMKFSRMSEAGKDAVVENTVEGVITRIEKDFFVVFSLKDSAGRTYKLYWMSQVASSLDLVNSYDSLLGKSIKVTYQSKDYFDPKIGDYRRFNLITRIW